MIPYCPKCKEPLPLRGGHACLANTADVANDLANSMANTPEPMANETYRYRDPDKRRAYMREYMRKKRSGKEAG